MIHKLQLLKRGIAVLVFAAAPLTSTAASAGSAVYVTDVEQLYAAVDNPANMGATVVLAPGIYQLSPTDPAGIDRTNLGRLELQKDMSLYGVAGDRAAVVIDAGALLQPSFSQAVRAHRRDPHRSRKQCCRVAYDPWKSSRRCRG